MKAEHYIKEKKNAKQKVNKFRKMRKLSRKLFAGVLKGLKCVFERTWSHMKAGKYRKEKKNAKFKGKKNQKDLKQCRKMCIFQPPGAR